MKFFRHTASLCAVAMLMAGAAFGESKITDAPPGQAKPGDKVTGADAQLILKQVKSERQALLEEHRLALLRAEKAGTPDAKLKIMLDLEAAQKPRRLKLHELAATVREAEKQEQEANREQNKHGG